MSKGLIQEPHRPTLVSLWSSSVPRSSPPSQVPNACHVTIANPILLFTSWLDPSCVLMFHPRYTKFSVCSNSSYSTLRRNFFGGGNRPTLISLHGLVLFENNVTTAVVCKQMGGNFVFGIKSINVDAGVAHKRRPQKIGLQFFYLSFLVRFYPQVAYHQPRVDWSVQS